MCAPAAPAAFITCILIRATEQVERLQEPALDAFTDCLAADLTGELLLGI